MVLIKRIVRYIVKQLAYASGIPQQLDSIIDSKKDSKCNKDYVDRGTQIALGIKYRQLTENGIGLTFGDIEFRNYSQNGEDGILWYVFSLIGTINKKCVEICAGDGIQCNCAV